MKKYINKKGTPITLGDTVSYMKRDHIITRIWRNKLGVVKLEFESGIIVEADHLVMP